MTVLLYAYRTFESGGPTLKITLMRQVVIENPILNSPFVEPVRHFRFTDDGITDEIIEARRISSYFIPIARPRSRGKQDQMQAAFEDWTADRIEENKLVNRIRERTQHSPATSCYNTALSYRDEILARRN